MVLIARILSRLTPILSTPATDDTSPASKIAGGAERDEAGGATTEAALLRSQACNKILNLVQHLMKIDGAAGLLRSTDGNQAVNKTASLATTKLPSNPTESRVTTPGAYSATSEMSDGPRMNAEGKAILRSVTEVLMAGPRTMLWFPALLKAAEVLQLLILDKAGATEFLANMSTERMPLAHGALESHILLDMLHSINSTLQPRKLITVHSQGHRSVDL